MYHDKCQSRYKFTEESGGFQTLKSNRISSKRRGGKSPEVRSAKLRKVDELTGDVDEERLSKFTGTVDTSTPGEPKVTPEKHETDVQALLEADCVENEGDLEPNEDDGEPCPSFISMSDFSGVKPARLRRFLWTEEADR